MPYIELPEELAESIADLVGVYGAGPEDGSDHPGDCKCRIRFVCSMTHRIKQAIANDAAVAKRLG